MIRRLLNIPKNKSFFLFGPRGTGKTTLIEQVYLPAYPPDQVWSLTLLDPDTEEAYRRRPALLKEHIEAMQPRPALVFIDEVQKIPQLLDVVHFLIEKYKITFALTGSSARKLKRGGANLLAGRAFEFKLHPLMQVELREDFSLASALEWGTLPGVIAQPDAENKARFLRAYVQTYLREEIVLEQIVRQVDGFRQFLEVAAQTNGKILNYAKIARDAAIDDKTVARFFEIARDTLIGFYLEPFSRSVRKRQAQKPKFYFFDTGVVRAITKELTVPLLPQSYAFGNAFEHWLILEVIRLNDYLERDYTLSYLRTKDDLEIDLIIQRPGLPEILVEIKSTERVDLDDLRHLRAVAPEFPEAEKIVLCREPMARKVDDILILPWQEGLQAIFARETRLG